MFFARSDSTYGGRKGKKRFSGGTINQRRAGPSKPNVGRVERIVSVAGGVGLVADGIRRMNLVGLVEGLAGAAMLHRGATGTSMVYRRLGVNTAKRWQGGERSFERGIHVEESVTVNCPLDQVYAFWRNFENLPRFMDHLESVQVIDDERSHWVVKAPAGTSVEWDARIINEEDRRVIAWESLLGADVDNKGSVRFHEAPAGRGTVIKVALDYIPPAGRFGAGVARLFGENPEQQLRDDLDKFRRIVESCDFLTTEGQPSGRTTRIKASRVGQQGKAGILAGAAGADHDKFEATPRQMDAKDAERE